MHAACCMQGLQPVQIPGTQGFQKSECSVPAPCRGTVKRQDDLICCLLAEAGWALRRRAGTLSTVCTCVQVNISLGVCIAWWAFE